MDFLNPKFLKNPLLFVGFQLALAWNALLLRVLYPAGIISGETMYAGFVNLLRFAPDQALRPKR